MANRSVRRTAAALVVAVALVVPAAGAAPASADGPSRSEAIAIAVDHVRDHRAEFGLEPSDLDEIGVSAAYRSAHNGLTHVYLTQQIGGLDVAGSSMTVAVDRDGDVLHVGPRFISGFQALTRIPRIGPIEATLAAARVMSLTPTQELRVAETIGGPERAVLLTTGGISRSPIPVRLLYHPVDGGSARLAWNLEIDEVSRAHWWNVTIDAHTGEVLDRFDYTIHEHTADMAVGHGSSDQTRPRNQAPRRVRPPKRVRDGSSYRVYRLPLESPNDGERTLEREPADRLGSPYGWHDLTGTEGPDSTLTEGNNVDAYVDYTGYGNRPIPILRTDGGDDLTFDFEMDEEDKIPHLYRDASVTNLFYWNNVIHDLLYRYGFDEAAGNFQMNNYGRGGPDAKENDPVHAEAQDHGFINNANFSTPPDGSPGRMQMYLWPNTRLRTIIDGDFDAGVIIHEYAHGLSNRLTGGPAKVDCLRNQEQAGEGWSDWVAIALTALPRERGPDPRGMGTYVLGQADRQERGIRPTPYSTSKAINPATYESIKTAAVPHGVGYVFATMLWEVYWNLVDKHGFNPNPYGSWRSGGNNLAIQLVVDGMKLQPCSPGFVDSRDAILAAEKALTGGRNRCEIWAAFATRGLGYRANQNDPNNRADVVEDFRTHPTCR